MNEQTLIRRARRGDGDAFGSLVVAYHAPIFNLCYRMLSDEWEAEDAAQETFLRAYSHLRHYDRRRAFKTWLFAIASHHCIDRLRRRRPQCPLNDEPPESDGFHAAPAGPEDSAIRREGRAHLQAPLNRLAPRDRQVIVLRYWYDCSYVEIADATHSSVSAVKSRLHRARCALAHLLRPRPSALARLRPIALARESR